MVVRYSTLNRLEVPKLTLCNPGSVYNNGLLTNVVGILIDHEAEEIVFNFNAVSELNLRVNKIRRDDPEDNAHALSLYNSIQNRRLLFVEDIGYFMITEIEDGYADGLHYKDVKAQSVDVEIQQKMIPFIADGTYRFSTDRSGEHKGILETIVEVLPLWTIGHVDSAVAEKWRTFEDVDVTLNCLGFLLDNAQNAYECIFIFDIINRVINVYSQDDYVRQTDIHITKEDLIDSIDISENADDLYTAISVTGNENVTISAINPLGTNVIYNFDYYLDWMSGSLGDKVRAWQDAVNSQMEPYYDLNLGYYQRLAEASGLELELGKTETVLTMYSRCRDNIVAEASTSVVSGYNTVIVNNGGTPITVYAEIADTLKAVDTLISECRTHQKDVAAHLDVANLALKAYEHKIGEIRDSVAFDKYFTSDEYAELCHYIFEGSYTDEYVTVTDIMSYEEKFSQMKILYDRAKSQLDKVSKPTREFDIDVENFVFIKEFEHWSEQLETGCLINVELDTDDIALLFLSNITVNYDDRSLSMTFGNRFNKFDPKSLFDGVLGNISKSANTLNYLKEFLYPMKNGEFDAMHEALQTSRDLTMGNALSSSNEEVVIDGLGYTGKKLLENGEYDPRQIKITGKSIVFTRDAWDSCSVALGELLFDKDGTSAYGINAEVIIGELILGERLAIHTDNDSLTFDKDGFFVTNGTNSFRVDPNSRDLLVLSGSEHDLLWVDDKGGLHIVGDGSMLDLTMNGTVNDMASNIKSLDSKIEQTAASITLGVTSVMDKYDTTGITVNLYGYTDAASSGYPANSNSGKYYLNQADGSLYRSIGGSWIHVRTLTSIADNLSSRITVNADNISSKVSTDDFSTLIEQNSSSVKIAWNNISNYVEFSDGALKIYSESSRGDDTLLMRLNSTGAWYYRDGYTVGRIGTNRWTKNESHKGLVFDLETEAKYMCWAQRDDASAADYVSVLAYSRANSLYDEEGIHFGCPTYAHGYLHASENVKLSAYKNGDGGLSSESGNIILSSGDSMLVCSPDTISAFNDLDLNNYNLLNQSDARLKTNIEKTDVNALDLINRIRLMKFDWIENNSHENIGIVAQQLMTCIPELVHEDEKTGKLSIKENKFIPYLIKAVQELYAMICTNGAEAAAHEISGISAVSLGNEPTGNGNWVDEYTIEEKERFVNSVSSAKPDRSSEYVGEPVSIQM